MSEQNVRDEYRPTSVSPPGDTLRELLEERGISQAEFAERSGRPRKTINEIIQGKTAITSETALQFELVLGVPAGFWTARETHYREYMARQEEERRLASQVKWAERFPLREMVQKGWLPKTSTDAEKVHSLLEFFGVASPEQWLLFHSKDAVAFRKSKAYEADEFALATWLRKGVGLAERCRCQEYSEERFRAALQEARSLTIEPPDVFQPRLEEICSNAGVALVFVPQLKGCRAHGSTRWVSPWRALIQLSLRYRTDDQLWFSFFHEAAHILLHRKKTIFLEFDGSGDAEDEEDEANKFSADFLIPPKSLEEFRRSALSKSAIRRFARELGISPGIAVGRLQYEGLLPHSHCNDLKVRLKWVDAT
jgi:HTH-type transcriptional regulator/antitoxin HigA